MSTRLLMSICFAICVSSLVHAQTPDWKDRISISGDFRLRAAQSINNTASNLGTTTNWKGRLRARLAIVAKVNDTMTLRSRLSTGGVALGSNRSSNEDFTRFNSKKGFDLELAYLDWKVADEIVIFAGKAPSMFWSPGGSAMVIHSEHYWEGAQAKWQTTSGSLKPFAALNYSILHDRLTTDADQADASARGPDVDFFGAQAGVQWSADPLGVIVSIASYGFNNIKGLPTSASTVTQNSTTGTGAATSYLYDYKLLDAGLEIVYKLSVPTSAFAHYVQNRDPSELNKAVLVGAVAGTLKAQGDWLAGVNYRDVAKDAVLGAIAESNFDGLGTDYRAWQITGGYQVWQNSGFVIAYMPIRQNVSTGETDRSAFNIDWVTTF